MSKPKPWKKPAVEHDKGIEVHKAQEHWPHFLREHKMKLKEKSEKPPKPPE